MEFGQIVAPTIKELFIERIEGMILSGQLKPGERLPSERDLAEQMKISKTIVHIGLEDLARMGFLEVTPRRGTVVADFAESGNLETLNAILRYNGGKLDRQMVVSIIELRSAVEGGALIRLGRSHTQEDLDELRDMLAEYAVHTHRRRRAGALPLPHMHALGQPALSADNERLPRRRQHAVGGFGALLGRERAAGAGAAHPGAAGEERRRDRRRLPQLAVRPLPGEHDLKTEIRPSRRKREGGFFAPLCAARRGKALEAARGGCYN